MLLYFLNMFVVFGTIVSVSFWFFSINDDVVKLNSACEVARWVCGCMRSRPFSWKPWNG
jgi:hypothetical protein